MTRAGTKGVPREQREQQILELATAEFGAHGYAHASLTRIASAAGVSKPLIYTYFGSRDGLHAACVHRAGTVLTEAVAAAQTASGAQARALATLDAIFHALDGHTRNWTLLYDTTLPRGSEPYLTARRYQDALNTMGAQGVAQTLTAAADSDPGDHSLMLSLWFGIVSTTIAWWSDHPGYTPDEMTARCVRLFTALRQSNSP
ncbi:TetR/AcrR family transcriptional regulator [Nocardia huaxiensis]|uniref:TetR/AcrR family transcriptional regulator n=1 Tax=Nocardia huaxiensis TaxID=2755382 RepID=A0A7D6V7U3_9NOCA|nr:TetR/AcrR family transcriptional regulator [Nocardia huaxiensis]QLY29641.1 TetR/AcrR family transcriptional regulator [Nocardia huaxiensis]UFS96785.1 TetR/AcrR family transcriptional regulator [Nocardia huaxiensis]